MLNCLFVGIGGFIGAVLRYLIGLIPYKMENGFPIKTLCINVIGAFLISVFAAWFAKGKISNAQIDLMLRVGICGGFTTFSTFAYETSGLLTKGSIGVAISYAVLSAVLGVLAVIAGQMLV